MKRIVTLFTIFAFIISTLTQVPLQAQVHCGFDLMMQQAKDKGYNEAAYEAALAQLIAAKKEEMGSRFVGIVTIPVIFHVIHRGETLGGSGSPNLAKAKIDAQIAQLNIDFGNTAGTSWPGVADDVEIRFCAAKIDPSGNVLSEYGIERINGASRGWNNTGTYTNYNTLVAYIDATIKPASYWDPYKYFNIWTMDMSSSGLLGYASFPALSTLPGLDNLETNQTAGIGLESGSVGSVASPGYGAPYNLGRTLTHEAGHFFGLRHIWGDGTCATDYCNDTPPQNTNTSGCPATGTLNGCTPSVPKMFQNYMDYSSDNCMNTFTGDQATRCQTVMDNSPRRKELINSPVCSDPNAVYFTTSKTIVDETATDFNCPKSRSVIVKMKPIVAATGNATVTFSMAGSATAGLDYVISPSSISFSNGDNSEVDITITIYDDLIIEGSENIILDYTISGTGVSYPAIPNKTHEIIINDNDINFEINQTNPVTVFNEAFATTGLPTGWSITENVASNNDWIVGSAAVTGFTTNKLYISNNGSALQYTANNNPASTYAQTPVINTSGLKNVNLSFTWVCNGETNAGVTAFYDFGEVHYSIDGTNFTPLKDGSGNVIKFYGQSAKQTFSALLPSNTWNVSNLKLRFYWENDNSVRNNPPFLVDDILVTGQAVTIESTLAHSTVDNLSTTGSNHLLSNNDGQIIISISRLSSNIPCAAATVLQAGNGNTGLTTNAGSYLRSVKVIGVTPASPNTTATYTVTLYFTTAELAAWGATASTLKIMKVRDGVSLSSTLTPAEAAIFATTFTDLRATKGYATYSADVTGGFSQFFVVAPETVLPVNITAFNAEKYLKDQVKVNWSCLDEANVASYMVQRSTKGSDFENIGVVNANRLQRYSLIDGQPAKGKNFYRLSIFDRDGKNYFSEIKMVEFEDYGKFSVYPNPTNDKLYFTGLNPDDMYYNVTIINDLGNVLSSQKMNYGQLVDQGLNMQDLVPGSYTIKIASDQNAYLQRVIKQ